MSLFRALRHATFAFLWLGRTVSRLGDGIQAIALAWLVLELTGSAAAMGLVLAAELLPTLALLVFGGAIVDRLPKVPLLIASDLVRAVVVGALAVMSATGYLHMPQLLVAAMTFGLVAAVFVPASMAIIPELVDREDRPSANALSQLGSRFAGIIGPLLGGVIVAAGGTSVAFALDALSFVASAAPADASRLATAQTDGIDASGSLGAAADGRTTRGHARGRHA